jgi:hypothetical protein
LKCVTSVDSCLLDLVEGEDGEKDRDELTVIQVQSKKGYYEPFFEVTKKIALQPQKIEVMKGVEEFRFMRS